MTKKITSNDFEKIIAEEIANGNGLNAYIRCFQLVREREEGVINEKIKLLEGLFRYDLPIAGGSKRVVPNGIIQFEIDELKKKYKTD